MNDLRKCIIDNQKYAFRRYVTEWKKQNPDTIEYQNGVFSYKTKKGVKKSFVVSKKPTGLKVWGFYFEEIKEEL